MIIYNKPCCGLLTFNYVGSPFPRIIIYSLLITALSAILEASDFQLVTDSRTLNGSTGFIHPYPYQIWAFLVGFGLIFRTNHAYGRYWDARMSLSIVSSKWSDAALQFKSFLLTPTPTSPRSERERLKGLNERWVHGVSFLHALCIMSLRGDDVDEGGMEGNVVVDYPSTIISMSRAKQSLSSSSYQNHHSPLRESKVTPTSITPPPPPPPPPPPSYPQPPYDSSSVLPLQSRISKIFFPRFTSSHNNIVSSLNPLPVLYPLTDSDLEVFSLSPSTPALPLSLQTQRLHSLAVKSLKEGDLDIPPPVFTRLLQVLSEGTAGYQRALAVKDTPFPFPYAQAIALMVWSFCLSVPFIVSAFVEGVALASVGTFVTVTSYLALNQVSREIEEPFGGHSNNLPLAWMQWTFNRRVSVSVLGME